MWSRATVSVYESNLIKSLKTLLKLFLYTFFLKIHDTRNEQINEGDIDNLNQLEYFSIDVANTNTAENMVLRNENGFGHCHVLKLNDSLKWTTLGIRIIELVILIILL